MKATSRTKTRPVSRRTNGVPERLHEAERTREVPAVSPEDEKAPAEEPGAAPQHVIPIEETVPFQSCIERTLLHEVLRRESAEEDEDHSKDR